MILFEFRHRERSASDLISRLELKLTFDSLIEESNHQLCKLNRLVIQKLMGGVLKFEQLRATTLVVLVVLDNLIGSFGTEIIVVPKYDANGEFNRWVT